MGSDRRQYTGSTPCSLQFQFCRIDGSFPPLYTLSHPYVDISMLLIKASHLMKGLKPLCEAFPSLLLRWTRGRRLDDAILRARSCSGGLSNHDAFESLVTSDAANASCISGVTMLLLAASTDNSSLRTRQRCHRA